MAYPEMPGLRTAMQVRFYTESGVEWAEITLPNSTDKVRKQVNDSLRKEHSDAYAAFKAERKGR